MFRMSPSNDVTLRSIKPKVSTAHKSRPVTVTAMNLCSNCDKLFARDW